MRYRTTQWRAHEARYHPPGCVFCKIVLGDAPATIIQEWPDALAIVPLNPVTEGHWLVLSRRHVVNAFVNPEVTGVVMRHAAELGARHVGHANLITSVGETATQTVPHLHVHLVPRHAGDGLPLPWTPQQR